jgi:hypothetical protein
VANTKIQVESAAPVSTLNITGEVIAVGASEPVLGDRDNDLDASHLVVEITDVATGVVTNTGKALALASASPLKPTIVTSGNKAGFLENESLPLPGDVNLDGDQFDQILRVYATDGTGSPAAELTNPPLVSANPLSKVRGRPLAISNECGTLPCPPSAPPNPVDFVFSRSDEDGDVPSLTERASRNDAREQEQANAGSGNPSIDDDGGLVAFDSRATNLVNESIPAGRSNVYVFDRATGEAELISAGASGSGGGDADSSNPSLSPDGGFVAFESLAGNLQ